MVRNVTGSLARQLWGLAIGQGVLAILFGILALFWPELTVSLLIVLFSVFVLVWGVTGIIVGLSTSGSSRFWWLELLFSVLAVGLAVYMLRNPGDTAAVFVILIGLTILARGVVDALQGLFDTDRSADSRQFGVIAGLVGVVAGIVTLLYPVSAGIVVVWVVGLYAVLYGALSIGYALRAQKDL